ncbi:OmpA family protein [Litorisediminicola beolgyonensis]|uniref:OmpA family protein n=1 Tax=Litorisediminicola beolgyonensis TaxID=1173614 RepID=A0ABW3ZKP5_9RHOB
MRFRTNLSLVCAALVAAAPAVAQNDLSVEEILERLEKQKQVFNEAETSGLGETRGLKLVTVEDVDAESAAPSDSVAVSAQGNGTATDPDEPIQAAADPNQPLVFGQLAPELQVNLQITFGFDSAALADSEKPKLDKMCAVLKQSDINLFRIVGHTDTSGSAEYNERLSVLRAKEVARYLVEDCGVAASRLQTIGMGERFPYNTADPRADENRRVEFQALS